MDHSDLDGKFWMFLVDSRISLLKMPRDLIQGDEMFFLTWHSRFDLISDQNVNLPGGRKS